MTAAVLPNVLPAARPVLPTVPARAAMLAGWAVLALFLAATHVHWRDEVRALSIALSGDTIVDMLRGLRGEGHPALWYVLLRLAHDVVPVREVLPAVGFAAGLAAAALLALRAPLPTRTVAAALFGYWSVFEYAVTDRNYGIAAALMLLFAALYPRRRWFELGPVLALIGNTSAPAVLLAGGLGLFWAVDVLRGEGWRWTRATQGLLFGAAVALAGVAACALTLFPTYNDAAVVPAATLGGALWAALLPARGYALLLPPGLGDHPLAGALLAPVLLGSLLALVRSPAALAAGAVGLWSYGLFFQLGHAGGYRHQALILPYLFTLCWLAADVRPAREPLQRLGEGLFALLLAAQVPATVGIVAQAASGGVMSRAADLETFVRAHRLEEAAVIGVPDVMVEPLAYYLPNPTWLVRERRWGRVVRFSRHVRQELTLDDVLADARRIAAERDRPVLVLVNRPLDPVHPAARREEGMVGTFEAPSDQVRRFLAATRRVARFGPAATDESYDVYLLPAPQPVASTGP